MKKPSFIQSDIFYEAYLGKAIDNLYKTVMGQMDAVYKARGLTFPVSSSSTLHYLSYHEGATLAEISKSLNATHQLSTQKIKILSKLGLVERRADSNDKRCYKWYLTAEGKDQTARLETCMKDVKHIFVEYYEELGFNLREIISQSEGALLSYTMEQRFHDKFPPA